MNDKERRFADEFNRENTPEGNPTGAEARDASKPRETQHETRVLDSDRVGEQTSRNGRSLHAFGNQDFCTVCHASSEAVEDEYISQYCCGEPLENLLLPPLLGFSFNNDPPLDALFNRSVAEDFDGMPLKPRVEASGWQNAHGNMPPLNETVLMRRTGSEQVPCWQWKHFDPPREALFGNGTSFSDETVRSTLNPASVEYQRKTMEVFTDGVTLHNIAHLNPEALETIEIVLPEAHWMRTTFSEWELNERNAGRWPADISLWEAFRAGANAIPGNPDKIAVLEQQLRDTQNDSRILVLERNVEELETSRDALAAHIGQTQSTLNELARELTHIDTLRAAVKRLDAAKDQLHERCDDLLKRITALEEYNEPPTDSERAQWEGRYLRLETALKAYTQLCDSHELMLGQQGKCIVENYSLALSAVTETNRRVTTLEVQVIDMREINKRIADLEAREAALDKRITPLENRSGR